MYLLLKSKPLHLDLIADKNEDKKPEVRAVLLHILSKSRAVVVMLPDFHNLCKSCKQDQTEWEDEGFNSIRIQINFYI